MPSIQYGQLDSDYGPFAKTGEYCTAVFPAGRDLAFDDGRVLPRAQREGAGSCAFSRDMPVQTQVPSAAGALPGAFGADVLTKTTQYFSTLDSKLAGNGPRAGGWHRPVANRVRTVTSGGGRKRRRRPTRKPTKKRHGKRTTRRPRRKSRKGRGRTRRN